MASQETSAQRQRVGRPTGADAEATRLLVVEAAIEAFAELGFDGASIRDIAARAGVTHGTVYFYFSSKPELYHAAYQETVRATFSDFEQLVDADTPLVEALSVFLDTAARLMAERPAYSVLALRYRTDPKGSPDLGAERPTETHIFLETLISRAVDQGELPPADQRAAVEALSVIIWGLTIKGVRDAESRAEAVKGLKMLFVGLPARETVSREVSGLVQ